MENHYPTVFSSRQQSSWKRNGSLPERFTLGIKEGLLWLQDHNGEDCREMLKAEFPDYDLDLCVETVDDFRKHGMWSRDVAVDKKPMPIICCNRWGLEISKSLFHLRISSIQTRLSTQIIISKNKTTLSQR